MSNEDIATFKEVSYKYPTSERNVLKNINLRIKKGESVVILGPTGSGKSTLLHAMSGLIPHFFHGDLEGEVIVAGMDTQKHPISELCTKMMLLLEDPESQFYGVTVEEDLAFAPENLLMPREMIGERIKDALRIVGMSGFEKRFPAALSIGQKQRIALAACLTVLPEILLLDEPTSMLDPAGKREIFSALKKIKEKRKITLVITDPGLESENIVPFADRIIVIYRGEIVQEGDPREIFAQVELLESVGIKPPHVSELSYRLRKEGIIKQFYVTQEEASQDLRKLFKGRIEEAPILEETPYIGGNERKVAISARNLWYRYPDPPTLALKGIDLTIHQGEFIGLIGENGSGKTTFSKICNGLLKPTEGDILLFGDPVTSLAPEDICRRVGYVFQNPNHQLFGSTVYEEVAFAPRNLEVPESKVEELVEGALKKMQLTELKNEYVFLLGLAQKQSVAVAGVMVLEPEVLIVDEPLTGQDWEGAREIMDFLAELNKRGTTVIIISHDMKIVTEYVQRVIVMHEGKVILDGPTREVFSRAEQLKEAAVVTPQIVDLARELKDYGFPPNILTVDEMTQFILKNR